jgi:hypothetical protein
MRCSRSAAKFECGEALAPDPRFAHGSNINSRDESCGKLVASGCRGKCLAAKRGQAERAKFGRKFAKLQPERVLAFGLRLVLHDFSMKKLANASPLHLLFHHDKAPGTQKAPATRTGLSARGFGPLVECCRSSSQTTG